MGQDPYSRGFGGEYIILAARFKFLFLGVILLVVSVTAAPVVSPVAGFSANDTQGRLPLPVLFTDTSKNTPTGWSWFFGDERYNAAWTEMTAGAGWAGRNGHTSVVLPDGSIVLMGGAAGGWLCGPSVAGELWPRSDQEVDSSRP